MSVIAVVTCHERGPTQEDSYAGQSLPKGRVRGASQAPTMYMLLPVWMTRTWTHPGRRTTAYAGHPGLQPCIHQPHIVRSPTCKRCTKGKGSDVVSNMGE